MKIRILALLLTLILLLAGCAKTAGTDKSAEPTAAPEATEAAEETAAPETPEETAADETAAPEDTEPTDDAAEAAADTEEDETAVESAYHLINAEEAKKMIDAGGVTIVDVRTEEEYREQHIPGSILVPNETIGSEAPEALPDKDAVLLVHCRSGVRSKDASDKLVALGYTQVYDFGGILDWPYETVSE